MIDNIETETVGSKVQLPIEQFKKLVSNYKILKEDNAKLKKAIDYLNNQIEEYNKEFSDGDKK